MASTIGYCHEILLWQNLHRPRKNTKLIIGILSYHKSSLPHEKHRDLPHIIVSPVFLRNNTTLQKLPTIVPTTNTKKPMTICTDTMPYSIALVPPPTMEVGLP